MDKYGVDRETLLSEYKCSFVHARENCSVIAQTKTRKNALDINLTGKEVKEFYESVINDDDASEGNKKQSTHGSKKKQKYNDRRKLKTQNKINKTQYENINKTKEKERVDEMKRYKKEEHEDEERGEQISITTSVTSVSKQVMGSSDALIVRRLINTLLKLCTSGGVKQLKNFMNSIGYRDDFKDIINSCDQFGWSALMCAAAAGHLQKVEFLAEHGCLYKNIVDHSGMSIFDICRLKKQFEVFDFLKQFDKDKHRVVQLKCDLEVVDNIVKCNICGTEFVESKRREHEASMIHIFKDKSKLPNNVFCIPDHNVGFQMMLRSGWRTDIGLGPEGTGRKNPIRTELKQDRSGLGLKDKVEKRVCHFSAFDEAAIKKTKPVNRVQKKFSKKTYEQKKKRDKEWEVNMRRYMSSDF